MLEAMDIPADVLGSVIPRLAVRPPLAGDLVLLALGALG